MSLGISIQVVKDDASPMMQAVAAGLTDRRGFHAAIAKMAEELTRNHLIGIAETKHTTADRLGAARSGHWGKAADADNTKGSATEEAAIVTVRQVGIGRAAHDVTIAPGAGKQWLTIPIHAAAYNQRAYRMAGLFFVQPKGKDYALLGRRDGTGASASVTWLYLLKRSVFQKQDRTLLPSDAEYVAAAEIGIGNHLEYLQKRKRTGGPN